MDLFDPIEPTCAGLQPALDDLERWAQQRAADGDPLRPDSLRIHRSMWRAFVTYCVERGVCWADLDGPTLLAFLGSRRCSPQQERRYLSLIAGVALVAGEIGARAAQVARGLGRTDGRAFAFSRENRPKVDTLPPRELRAVVTTLLRWITNEDWRAQRDAALFATLVGAGLKPGESVGLSPADVATSSERGAPFRIAVAGHGPTPARHAPIAWWAARILGRWIAQRERLDLPGWRLFPNGIDAGALEASTVLRRFELLMDEAGVSIGGGSGSPHLLRHTWIVRQLEQGTDPMQVREWVGFTSAAAMEPYRGVLRVPAAVV